MCIRHKVYILESTFLLRIIFDDSFEHEVWHYNERNESRLILYFDFWNPDLRPEKRVWQPIQFDAYGNLIPNL